MLLLLPWKLRYLIASKVKGKGRGYEGTVGDSGHTSLHLLPQL